MIMAHLGDALIARITLFLPLPTVAVSHALCKWWNQALALTQQMYWFSRIISDFEFVKLPKLAQTIETVSWKAVYRNCMRYLSSTSFDSPSKALHHKVLEPLPDATDLEFNGLLSMSPNSQWLAWYNGLVLQCFNIQKGIVEWELAYTMRAVDCTNATLLCLNDKVLLRLTQKVFAFHMEDGRYLQTLKMPHRNSPHDWKNSNDISVGDTKLFLSGDTQVDAYNWDLKYLYCIIHAQNHLELENPCEKHLEFSLSIYSSYSCELLHSKSRESVFESPSIVQPTKDQSSNHVLTWLTYGSQLKIWDIETGKSVGSLVSKGAQIAVARNNTACAAYYITVLVDTRGKVTFWKMSGSKCTLISVIELDYQRILDISLLRESLMILMDDATLQYVVSILYFDDANPELSDEKSEVFADYLEFAYYEQSDAFCFPKDSPPCETQAYEGRCSDSYIHMLHTVHQGYSDASLPQYHQANLPVTPTTLQEAVASSFSHFALLNNVFITGIKQIYVPWTAFAVEPIDAFERYVGVWVSMASPGDHFNKANAELYVYDTGAKDPFHSRRFALPPPSSSSKHNRLRGTRGKIIRRPIYVLRARGDVFSTCSMKQFYVVNDGSISVYDFSRSALNR